MPHQEKGAILILVLLYHEGGPSAPTAQVRGHSALEAGPFPAERLAFRGAFRPASGAYVLYWMQKAQRASENPALEYAIGRANELGLPLLVLFCLCDYPAARAAHYRFMLAGLAETAEAIRSRGAAFKIERGDPPALVLKAAGDATLVVTEAGRLRIERGWRESLAADLARLAPPRPLVEVETEAVVPPDSASMKEEWSAATFRRRISPLLPLYLAPLPRLELKREASVLGLDAGDELFALFAEPEEAAYPGDRSPSQRPPFPPGPRAALERFEAFLEIGLERYALDRNDPSLEGQSCLSPYLHFGQVSPAPLARQALERGGPGAEAFVEQLVVRRELAANFVLRNPAYDRYDGLPAWARKSLGEAAGDRREQLYTGTELEAASTHDPYWNAAQDEMVLTGKMHNYLRMYWGKKILEWSPSPEAAFALALRLNDRYSLDGRDPNGYAGVAWCFGKHDRPWVGRPVFGTIRYMNAAGLKRKFDIERYVARIEGLRRSADPAR